MRLHPSSLFSHRPLVRSLILHYVNFSFSWKWENDSLHFLLIIEFFTHLCIVMRTRCRCQQCASSKYALKDSQHKIKLNVKCKRIKFSTIAFGSVTTLICANRSLRSKYLSSWSSRDIFFFDSGSTSMKIYWHDVVESTICNKKIKMISCRKTCLPFLEIAPNCHCNLLVNRSISFSQSN